MMLIRTNHPMLNLFRKVPLTIESTPLNISSVVNVGPQPSFRPKWKHIVSKRVQNVIINIVNSIDGNEKLMEVLRTELTNDDIFTPVVCDGERVRPITFQMLLDDINGQHDVEACYIMEIQLTGKCSRIFGKNPKRCSKGVISHHLDHLVQEVTTNFEFPHK